MWFGGGAAPYVGLYVVRQGQGYAPCTAAENPGSATLGSLHSPDPLCDNARRRARPHAYNGEEVERGHLEECLGSPRDRLKCTASDGRRHDGVICSAHHHDGWADGRLGHRSRGVGAVDRDSPAAEGGTRPVGYAVEGGYPASGVAHEQDPLGGERTCTVGGYTAARLEGSANDGLVRADIVSTRWNAAGNHDPVAGGSKCSGEMGGARLVNVGPLENPCRREDTPGVGVGWVEVHGHVRSRDHAPVAVRRSAGMEASTVVAKCGRAGRADLD
jgi:hypothetical protein